MPKISRLERPTSGQVERRLDPWPARAGVCPLDRTSYAARARLEANPRLNTRFDQSPRADQTV